MEKNLIKELLSPDPPDRPDDLAQIIDVIDYLIETVKGRINLNNLVLSFSFRSISIIITLVQL